MTTPRVDNPSHRGKLDEKICHFCGKVIEEDKWVTKQTKRSKGNAEFRQYHENCWMELFN